MAVLDWCNSKGAVLPGGSVRTGKEVLLSGRGYSTQPDDFTVYRRFGLLLRRFRERKGKPATCAVGNPLVARAVNSEDAQAGPWVLRSPGRRLKWRVFFEDDQLGRSEELHVSRLGAIGPSTGVAIGPFVFGINTQITAAVDPVVQLSVMTPWGGDEDDFSQYINELAEDATEDGEDSEETLGALREYLERYLPSDPPEGWEFVIEQDEFELEEGESTSIQILVQAPTAGATAFAVQMTGEVEGERVTVASDPMVIHVPEDWRHATLLFGGDSDAGGGSARKPVDYGEIAEGAYSDPFGVSRIRDRVRRLFDEPT